MWRGCFRLKKNKTYGQAVKKKISNTRQLLICSFLCFFSILIIVGILLYTIDLVSEKETTLDRFMESDISRGRYAEAYSDYCLFRGDFEMLPKGERMAPYEEFAEYYDNYIHYVIYGDEAYIRKMESMINSTQYKDNVPHYKYIIGLATQGE